MWLLTALWLSVLIFSVNGQNPTENYDVECPGFPSRPGVLLECLSTKLGAVKFNCSSPMPIDTVAYFSCQPFHKETSSPGRFDVKSMRCDKEGRWTRYNYYSEFKCEYECGRAVPIVKTTIVKGQLKTRTTWPWHALIYLKLNWAKVLEAIQYRRLLIDTATGKNDDGANEEVSAENNSYVLDPIKLAEIFSNDDLSREEILDPRYRYLYICGGTLISGDKILTAAHCLTDMTGRQRAAKEFMVVLGGVTNSFHENAHEPKSQIIPVSTIHISEDFVYNEFRSDIAVIQLQHSAILSNSVLPACLPDSRDDAQLFIANKKHGEVIGSMISIYREGLSNELQSKRLQVLPNIECVRNIERIPTDKEFCAGSSSASICSGDSGGGLVGTPNVGLKRRYTVKGIISYARARRICENYAVFTRVYKYLTWIQGILHSNTTHEDS